MNRLSRLKIRKVVRDEIGKAIKIRDSYYDSSSIHNDENIRKAINHFEEESKSLEKGSSEYRKSRKNLNEAKKLLKNFTKLSDALVRIEASIKFTRKRLKETNSTIKTRELQKEYDALIERRKRTKKIMNDISKKYKF